MNQVESTRNYSMFKLLSGNRNIDRFHLKKLKSSIEKNNQLNLHPIIVNQKYEVIDGQHRLSAAKDLNLEIFYIKSDHINDEHLIECNVNQKSFEVENYIDFFAIREKNETYLQLKQMLKSSGLKPKALLTLLLGTVNTNILEFLKTGRFRFPTNETNSKLLDFYNDFIAYANDKRIVPNSMFKNHNFTRAFRWIFNTTGFDSQVFFKKLDMKWFELKPQRNAQEWYILLIGIYNFKNQGKIEMEFGVNE